MDMAMAWNLQKGDVSLDFSLLTWPLNKSWTPVTKPEHISDNRTNKAIHNAIMHFVIMKWDLYE